MEDPIHYDPRGQPDGLAALVRRNYLPPDDPVARARWEQDLHYLARWERERGPVNDANQAWLLAQMDRLRTDPSFGEYLLDLSSLMAWLADPVLRERLERALADGSVTATERDLWMLAELARPTTLRELAEIAARIGVSHSWQHAMQAPKRRRKAIRQKILMVCRN